MWVNYLSKFAPAATVAAALVPNKLQCERNVLWCAPQKKPAAAVHSHELVPTAVHSKVELVPFEKPSSNTLSLVPLPSNSIQATALQIATLGYNPTRLRWCENCAAVRADWYRHKSDFRGTCTAMRKVTVQELEAYHASRPPKDVH